MSRVVGTHGSGSPPPGSCIFYKLMVASILQDKKLKIPKMFVKRYGNELSSVARITVPDGRIWLIELQKLDSKLWFQTGWYEFTEFYSITTGHFLIFRYEGKSRFNVHIYDLTVSEINYPFSARVSLWEPSQDKTEHRLIGDRIADSQVSDIKQMSGIHSSCVETTCSTSNKRRSNCSNSLNYGVSNEKKQSLRRNPSSRDIGIQFDGNELDCSEREGRSRRQKRRTDEHELLVLQKVEVKSTNIKVTSQVRQYRRFTHGKFRPRHQVGVTPTAIKVTSHVDNH